MLLALALTTLAAGPVDAITWSGQVPVSPLARSSCGGALAASSANGRTLLHAVYASAQFGRGVYYRRSTNGGLTWSATVVLASDTPRKACATIAASSSVVAVAWFESAGGVWSIRVRASTTNGRTFGPERRVPALKQPDQTSVAVVGSRIVVGWTDLATTTEWGWSRVAVSRDLGAHWSVRALDARLSRKGGTTKVAASGNRVFAAWLRSDRRTLVGRFSIDGGSTWQAPQVLGVAPELGTRLLGFSVAARPDRAAIAWDGADVAPGEAGPRVHYRVFAAGTWRPPGSLTASRPDPDRYVSAGSTSIVLLATSRVGVAFSACREVIADETPPCGWSPISDVLWAESLDNGTTWSGPDVASAGGETVDGMSLSGAGPAAVWPSGALRAILIHRFETSPADVQERMFVVRGT